MAMRTVRIIDQEIAQYLPRLNDQQKEAVLSVVAEEVIEDVFWTDSAKKSFSKIIEYLDTNWTEREVGKFMK
jgi:hypothetical protein